MDSVDLFGCQRAEPIERTRASDPFELQMIPPALAYETAIAG